MTLLKAYLTSWRTYVVAPWFIVVLPIVWLHLIVVLLKTLFELIQLGFVWLSKYTRRPFEWMKESPKVLPILQARHDAAVKAQIDAAYRNVFGNTTPEE